MFRLHLDLKKFDEKKPPCLDSFAIRRTRFRHSLQAGIYDLARKGQVAIVGRGGEVLLKKIPGTLHVKIIAPFDLGVRRLAENGRSDEKQGWPETEAQMMNCSSPTELR